MIIVWGTLAGLMLYLEIVFHLSGFGWSRFNPIYGMMLIIAWSGIQTMLIGVLKKRLKKIFFCGFIWLTTIWTCVQLVYYRIFKQPLLWEAVFRGGQDALTNYWREALEGVLGALPILILLLLPAVIISTVLHGKQWPLPQFTELQVLRTAVIIVAGSAGCIVTLEVGKTIQADYYEDYQEFYDPLGVVETMGVLPTLQRDTSYCAVMVIRDLFGIDATHVEPVQRPAEQGTGISGDSAFVAAESTNVADRGEASNGSTEAVENGAGSSSGSAEAAENGAGASNGSAGTEENGAGASNGSTEAAEKEAGSTDGITAAGDSAAGASQDNTTEGGRGQKVVRPQQFSIDFETLHALADNDKQTWLADYMEGLAPTTTNAYTGIFEGYNLIYLTAEGFCSYAVREDLTPTLYRLTHSGFLFDNYYVPLWQTSTSDGEYINCTGLIPDGQFSMRKSSVNNMAFTLPKFFAQENVYSYAYHNNSLSYYDRYVTHPNLGYDFKGCKLGELSEEECGGQIFPMEHPGQWPASDLEMMQGTIPEYIGNERFHVYYMTVSGHMNYNFKGNAMSSKNRDAVAKLEMSENARAYIACNIELDKALEYLLQQLEAAGQLEKTVICLSADHYPYAMTKEQYEELAGKALTEGMDLYRNSLILWNAGMEEQPIHVTKACGSMDIIPTLLNLFGFDFDSRMYAGRDIFSEGEGLVIFNDRSFVSDAVIYNRKGKQTIWLQDENGNDIIPEDQKEAYLSGMKKEVKNRYQFSAYLLQENYYQDVVEACASGTEE